MVVWQSSVAKQCGKAASVLERILCAVVVKEAPGKYGQVHRPPCYNWKNRVNHHTINQLISQSVVFETLIYFCTTFGVSMGGLSSSEILSDIRFTSLYFIFEMEAG